MPSLYSMAMFCSYHHCGGGGGGQNLKKSSDVANQHKKLLLLLFIQYPPTLCKWYSIFFFSLTFSFPTHIYFLFSRRHCTRFSCNSTGHPTFFDLFDVFLPFTSVFNPFWAMKAAHTSASFSGCWWLESELSSLKLESSPDQFPIDLFFLLFSNHVKIEGKCWARISSS